MNDLFFGIEGEGFRSEADVGVSGSGDGKELLKEGRVLADEFYGAEWELEGAFDEGDGEGLGGFIFYEGFERE